MWQCEPAITPWASLQLEIRFVRQGKLVTERITREIRPLRNATEEVVLRFP